MKAADHQLERQFIWTAIPAGRIVQKDAGQKDARPMALVTLLLTPRLLGTGTSLTVSSFKMQRWPEQLASAGFFASIQQNESNPVRIRAQRVPYVTAEGEQISFSLHEQLRAWETLFGADLFVRPYGQSSYAGRRVRTFPAAEAAKVVRRAYSGAARAHLEHGCDAPRLNPALGASLKSLRESWKTGLQRMNDGTCEPPPDASPLARAYDFYRREDHCDFTPPAIHLDEPAAKPEFHEIVAKLADHPLLLRALGLVIDLALPISALTSANLLAIIPDFPDTAANPSTPSWADASIRHRNICPRTRYELSGSRFLPQSTGRIHHGMLALAGAGLSPSENPQWEVVPFDVDGAVLRIVGSAADSAGDETLPALRSMGFALVQHDREKMHEDRVRRSQQLANVYELEKAVLDAEDLLGGYRLDVLDSDTGKWRSLCRRRVRYTIGGVSIGQGPRPAGPVGLLEEAFVRPLPASTGASAADALYVHEAVLRWVGWSHAVQRPDRIVETSVMPHMPASSEPPFESKIEPEPGSLPRLQFGRTYRIRIRAADLTGGGLCLDEADHDEERTKDFKHRRFDPILPPELVPTKKYQDGEAHERLLIRSDRNVPVDEYAGIHGYRPYDLRHILAPKSSLELAMQHRYTFDSAFGADAPTQEIERLFEVAKRADRHLMDIPGAVKLETGPDGACYIVVPEQGVKLPWLADPMAKALALHLLSRPLNQTGQPGQTIGLPQKCLWRGDWHSRLPVALRLVPANAGCTVKQSEDGRTLIVALGPAEEVTLEISSCPLSENVDLLGIPAWLGISSDDDIAWGKHRMITPKHTVTLVHAVQRPLCDPSGKLKPEREAGATTCVLETGELNIDTASTARIDIRACWTDIEDIPSEAKPGESKHNVQVGSYDVPYGKLKLPEIRQEFGDTRRRRVTYHVTALSRFQEYFERVIAQDPRACLVHGELRVTDVPSSARPPAPKLLYTVPTFRWEQSTDGVTLTRRRHGGGLRVFFERPWFASGEDEALGVLAWRQEWLPPQDLSCVSVAGRDPVWNTGAPPFILTGDFINAPSTEEYLREANRPLQVLVHSVQFDQEGGRWYADIDLSKVAGWSYSPFVRLVLARYQANTVDKKDKLSAPVRTEPIQLPPDRRLIVTRTSGGATATLNGLGPAGPKQNLVTAEVQVLEAVYEAEAPEEAHTGVVEAPIEPEDAVSGWTTVYSVSGSLDQTISLDIPASGHRPMRLLVREFETHPPQISVAGSPVKGSGRLVYADTVPLGSTLACTQSAV